MSPKVDAGHQFDKLNPQEREIMAQWQTYTYRSFSENRCTRHIWQNIIPQVSMEQPILKNSLFALSTMHLASSTSDVRTRQGYLRVAQAYQAQARSYLYPALKNINNSNRIAVFTSSCMMMTYEFAFHLGKHINDNDDVLHDLCKVFELTRESLIMIRSIVSSDYDGQIRPLTVNDEAAARMPNLSHLVISVLHQRNASLGKTKPQHETAVYEQSIVHLGSALESLSRGGEALVVALRWIVQIPSRFLELLEDRQQFALVVIAHYAVIIHNLRGHWWIGEWSERVLRGVCQHLHPQWMQSISWVIDATGFCAFGL